MSSGRKNAAGDRPRFFVDENIIGVGHAIGYVRSDIVYPGHPQFPEVPRRTEDQVWLPIVSQRSLVIISRDKKIRYRPAEIEAFKTAKARMFLLGAAGNLNNWDMLCRLLRRWGKIEQIVAERPEGPWFYTVRANGVREADL